jgi:hypothetical protein
VHFLVQFFPRGDKIGRIFPKSKTGMHAFTAIITYCSGKSRNELKKVHWHVPGDNSSISLSLSSRHAHFWQTYLNLALLARVHFFIHFVQFFSKNYIFLICKLRSTTEQMSALVFSKVFFVQSRIRISNMFDRLRGTATSSKVTSDKGCQMVGTFSNQKSLFG